MTQDAEQVPSPQVLKQGYEPPGVNNRGLLIFFFFFVLTAAVLHTGLWVLVKYYLKLPRAVDVVSSAAPVQQRFPPPNLQPIERHNELPFQDLRDLRVEKDQIFTQLGWTIDAATGLPAIPDQIVSQLAVQRTSSSTRPATEGGQR